MLRILKVSIKQGSGTPRSGESTVGRGKYARNFVTFSMRRPGNIVRTWASRISARRPAIARRAASTIAQRGGPADALLDIDLLFEEILAFGLHPGLLLGTDHLHATSPSNERGRCCDPNKKRRAVPTLLPQKYDHRAFWRGGEGLSRSHYSGKGSAVATREKNKRARETKALAGKLPVARA